MREENVIHVKMEMETKVSGTKEITVRDVAELAGPANLCQKIEPIPLHRLTKDEKKFHVSFLDVARAAQEKVPEAVLLCAGEKDSLIVIETQSKPSPLPEFFKVASICLILFFGSALAIMSFHNDVSLPYTFRQIHQMMTGQVTERPLVLVISYTVGMALGIFVFFNHVGKKKISDDPTPIQVQFTAYKKQVDECTMEELEKNK